MAHWHHEITAERFYEMLGAVPPHMRNRLGFLLGEAVDIDADGNPRFRAFVEADDRYFEMTNPVTMAAWRQFCGAPPKWAIATLPEG